MPRVNLKTVYSCQKCGYQSPKWLGKCPDCQNWNTFAEEAYTVPRETDKEFFFELKSEAATLLPHISTQNRERISVGITELDRVLGGGIVPGSMILLGGDPGIGKSTLILQSLDSLAKKGTQVLYATGEESAQQIKIRADRLNISSQVYVIAENSVERIINQVQKIKPDLLVVDSIQTVYLSGLESSPGSLSQVRESAGKLLYLSKTMGVATIVIGHVTKDGSLAGPRVLEHMVDCVLYFEGDSKGQYRILRTIKNRFGSTNEIGVFEMSQGGLIEVSDPSSLFISDHTGGVSGSTITASLEGGRPFLVEIQALVSSTSLANPRRTTLGVDGNRTAMIIAVLEKIVGLNLYNQDIYVNAAGGFKIMEPSADLAIMASLISSFKNKPISSHTLVLGEVGLSGEIRSFQGLEIRLGEAARMGFKKCLIPKVKGKINYPSGLNIEYVDSVSQLIGILF